MAKRTGKQRTHGQVPKGLPQLTAAESKLAAHPKTDADEARLTKRIWECAEAVRQSGYREFGLRKDTRCDS